MTERRTREQRDNRPAPVLIHDGMVIPGCLAAELAGALDLLDAYIRGIPPSAAYQGGRLPRAVFAVRLVARDAAVKHHEQVRRATAVANAARPVVLAPARAPAVSEDQQLTTAQAAALAGITESRVRQLAAAGTIRGVKTSRDVWLLDPRDVRAYAQRRQAA